MDLVYSELHHEAFQWAKQCVSHSEELAADVLQTVYLKILNGKAKYGEKSSLKTWLFSVIKFTAMDFYRSRKKQEPLDVLHEMPDKTKPADIDADFYSAGSRGLSTAGSTSLQAITQIS